MTETRRGAARVPARLRARVIGWVLAGTAPLGAATVAAQTGTYFVEVTDRMEGVLETHASRSVALADYDRDGFLELLTAFHLASPGTWLWHQGPTGGFWQDLAALPAAPSVMVGGGAGFADYDNDGDLDLFVPVGMGYNGRDLLLRNDRGAFHEVGQAAGLLDESGTDNAIWLDYDRDGYVDLYTGSVSWTTPPNPDAFNRLYRNLGDGTFREVTAQAGLLVPLGSDGLGSNGGMAAADFTNDGWPDLYVGVYEAPKRLFVNDRQGRFTERGGADLQDLSQALGVAVGDIDNDGDLDLFQAAGGGLGQFRSFMLLNLGDGTLVKATAALGLAVMSTAATTGAALGDIDNDGDLDLLTARPAQLLLNRGDGTFSDATPQSGLKGTAASLALGDFDQNGYLDVLSGFEPGPHLFVNTGSGSHWLRVEAMGVQSNRVGIGARLIATAGTLTQIREVLGGTGWSQDEPVAHFGLGDRTSVDRLEIRWPSGQVDVLSDIAADQQIRVVEGQGQYQRVAPAVIELPDTLVAGTRSVVSVRVRPVLAEPGARVTAITADLSALGGPAAVELEDRGGGTFATDQALLVGDRNQTAEVAVWVDQITAVGPYWSRFLGRLMVVPAHDLVIFGDGLATGWRAGGVGTSRLDLAQTDPLAAANQVVALEAGRSWQLQLQPDESLDPTGYVAVRFSLFPAQVTGADPPRIDVALTPSSRVSVIDQVDLSRAAWQSVEVTLAAFDRQGPLTGLILSSNVKGTLYLDDLRLVAAPFTPPSTAVAETVTRVLPQSPALAQNYPNPFNSSTVFRFSLPQAGEVGLSVYDLLGQRLAVLVAGPLAAGEHTVTWDGRDGQGRPLASGVYLCRLEAGGMSRVRRLALVR